MLQTLDADDSKGLFSAFFSIPLRSQYLQQLADSDDVTPILCSLDEWKGRMPGFLSWKYSIVTSLSSSRIESSFDRSPFPWSLCGSLFDCIDSNLRVSLLLRASHAAEQECDHLMMNVQYTEQAEEAGPALVKLLLACDSVPGFVMNAMLRRRMVLEVLALTLHGALRRGELPSAVVTCLGWYEGGERAPDAEELLFGLFLLRWCQHSAQPLRPTLEKRAMELLRGILSATTRANMAMLCEAEKGLIPAALLQSTLGNPAYRYDERVEGDRRYMVQGEFVGIVCV